MEIRKGDIVNRAGEELRISGITSELSSEDSALFLGRLEELAAQLKEDGLDSGYLFSQEYGEADPNDDSGLELWMIRPFAMLLANDVASSFGPEKAAAINQIKVSQAYESLSNGLVEVASSKYPETLPIGAANEYIGGDSFFYRGNEPRE